MAKKIVFWLQCLLSNHCSFIAASNKYELNKLLRAINVRTSRIE